MYGEHYLVLIGDIIHSRALNNRSQFQQQFKEAVKLANKSISTISPFTITIGDEFQAVFTSANHIFHALNVLEYHLQAASFRYGIGFGGISTQINYKAAIAMDGPAFHMARASLNVAKKNNLKYHFSGENIKPELINILLNWLGKEEQSFSQTKKNIFYLRNMGFTQQEIAAMLNISQPAISKSYSKRLAQLLNQTSTQIEQSLTQLVQPSQSQLTQYMVAEAPAQYGSSSNKG